jgi:hypothetical protein
MIDSYAFSEKDSDRVIKDQRDVEKGHRYMTG